MVEPIPTTCAFCSLGCTLLLRPPEGAVYHGDVGASKLDYDTGGAVNRGSLCAKGNMTLELLEHPRRLESVLARRDGALVPVSWDEGIEGLVRGLDAIRNRMGGHAIGLLAGPLLTDEEAGLLVRWARALGTRNLDLGDAGDRPLLSGLRRCPAAPRPVESVEQIERMTATLVVGDPFNSSPCIARSLLNARYDRRRNLQGVLASTFHRTDWFAKPRLRCLPGRDGVALTLMLDRALELAGSEAPPWGARVRETCGRVGRARMEEECGLRVADIDAIVVPLREEPESGIVFAAAFGAMERLDLAVGVAAALAEATGSRFLPLPEGANARGVERVLHEAGFPHDAGLTAAEMIEGAATGDLQALVAFGCDPLASHPGERPRRAAAHLDLLACAAPQPGETTAAAHLVFPSLLWGEKPGTVHNAFLRKSRLGVALRGPGAARAEHELLESLLARTKPAAEPGADPGRTPADARLWCEELEFIFRAARRGGRRMEAGTHLLLPRPLAAHAADGWLTRGLSWPRHEGDAPQVALTPAHAARVGVGDGTPVIVAGAEGRVRLAARVDARIPEGVVLVPPHYPEVRRLMRWRFEGALREVEQRPSRVSVEPAGEEGA